MNNKITLPSLAALLALRSGLSKKACEEFLRELFDLVGSTLADGESVKIQDLGTFRVSEVDARMSVDVSTGDPIEIPGHRKVVFVPDKDLAAAINEPFEAFEPREIPDIIPEEIELDGESEAPALESLPQPEEPASSPEPEPATVPENAEATSGIASEEVKSEKPESEEVENEEVESVTEIAARYAQPLKGGPELEPSRRFGFSWGFLAGFLTCLAACGIIAACWLAFSNDNSHTKPQDEMPTEEILAIDLTMEPDSTIVAGGIGAPESDSIETTQADLSVPTSPSDDAPESQDAPESRPAQEKTDMAPVEKADNLSADKTSQKKVYDTVSTTRYLTTMAKEHYGNYNLWPYIYEENKAILGHPDRIRPGTKVVIPPLSKYGVNPNSKAEIEKAKRKGAAIYARYR